jgi:hypothetical protein
MTFHRDSTKIAFGFLGLGVLGLSLLISTQVWAQVTGATLSGTVTDASGAIIPKAEVSIKNVGTGVIFAAAVNADGLYSAPNLLPGAYDVTCSAPGFTATVRSGITLQVGAQQVLDFNLKVGQVTESVHVTGEAPAVQLASSSIGTVVGSDAIVELPLNGRDWTSLANLEPAVHAVLTQQVVGSPNGPRGNRGFGNQLTISGTRPQQNNYRLDGISIVDQVGGAPGSVEGVALGVDAIAEFSVLTSNYTAEYGRTSGGVINAITKSGTNQIHGDAYWFLRDEGFDARNFFDVNRAPFHRDQFGGSVGAPIQKDKTFFFADYEGFRQDLGTTHVFNVPSPDARNGILHNADGTTTTITVDPLVQPFLAFWPSPNAGLVGTGNTGHFDIATTDATRENFATVKIDRRFSEKDSISGTWFDDMATDEQPSNLDVQLLGNISGRQMIALEETHVFNSSLVNSVRFGYSRNAVNASKSVEAINPLAAETSLGAFPGRFAPFIAVPGLTQLQGGLNGTASTQHWNSFQVYDDAFLTKGVHSLKFGFAFERMQNNPVEPNTVNGNFVFGSLLGFLTNEPVSFIGSLGLPVHVGQRQSLFGGYLQDDWRLRPNLTLNLGLRYEAVTVPTEIHGFLSNLLTFTSPTPHLGSPYFNNPTLRNFEPRIGFSWDPFRQGKTAVRGAFGMFDVLPLEGDFFLQMTGSEPFGAETSSASLPPGSFPMEAAALSTALPSNLQNASIQFHPPRNYVMIWNLNVQQQLTPSTVMTIGYVGNRGVHMLNRADDVNDVLPTQTSQGLLWPFPAGSGTRLNPNSGDIRGIYWDGDSFYDALEVQVSKRMSHGFQVQGSYTWGKNIDTGSASVIGDPFTNSISSLFWFCKTCRRGLSDYNIGQTLVINYIWEVPTPNNWGAIGSHILGGWEVGGIITAETGVPITPLIGGDPLGLNNSDPYAFPNRLRGPGCGSAVNPGNVSNYINLSCFALPVATPGIAAQCTPFGFPTAPIAGTCANLLGNAGRNSVIGPGLATWDFSLFKNNHINRISEAFNLQFRVEIFNILNRANFATPVDNETLFNQDGTAVGGAGSLDQTSTTSREIQFALKMIW